MQVYLDLMGHEFVLDVDWTLTHGGSRPIIHAAPEDCDPGSDPEWEINSITLQEDRYNKELGPAFKATGALFDVLATRREIDEAILEYIWENGEDEDSYYDEDYHRER